MNGSNDDNIRVIVAIDFGVTHSTFAYANKLNQEIIVNESWPEQVGALKTNTALLYDEKFRNVEEWGYSALARKPKKKSRDQPIPKPVEYFKLHLSNRPENEKPPLPEGLSYKKAIADYLKSMGNLIKETITTRWSNLNVMEQVLFILTIPEEFSDKETAIMRECILNAGLIATENSDKLLFINEAQAAATYCVKILKERHSSPMGKNILIVDCGGSTVNLTTHQILSDESLEKSIRSSENVGGMYIDEAFLTFIGEKVGPKAIQMFQENHNGEIEHMIHEFGKKVKLSFSGGRDDFKPYELDLDDACPSLKQYVNGEMLNQLEEDEWIIELKFDNVKKMFNPVVKKIVASIHDHLERSESDTHAMFLVGDFSESRYLQKRIQEEFSADVNIILIPPQPTVATVKGAIEYGLDMHKEKPRMLSMSYGIELGSVWRSNDPSERQQTHNRIFKFRRLVEKGRKVEVDETFEIELFPSYESQTEILVEVYSTTADVATYCDEPGMKRVAELMLDFPDIHLGTQRKVKFMLTFGQTEVCASLKNQHGKSINSTFKLEL